MKERKKWENNRVEDVLVNFETDSGLSLPMFSKIIEKARQQSEWIGAELVFVYSPSYEKYAYSAETYHDDVISIVRELGIRVIDFSVFLDKQSDPIGYFPFRRHGHYTPETYSILSNYIVRNLKEKVVAEQVD